MYFVCKGVLGVVDYVVRNYDHLKCSDINSMSIVLPLTCSGCCHTSTVIFNFYFDDMLGR